MKGKIRLTTLCYILGIFWIYKFECLLYVDRLFAVFYLGLSLLQLFIAIYLLQGNEYKIGGYDKLIIAFCVLMTAINIINKTSYTHCLKEVIRILLMWSTVKIGVTSDGGKFFKWAYKISLACTVLNTISVIIFPNSMYVDAMGAASVFLLGGDNATIRLYILSIMFGVLYNFYHRKKYKIPVFAIFNLILFAFLRDIATAKLMAVIIVAFLLILEVKDIKFLTPTFSIIFNAFIFFTVVIMQSISNFYVNIFEALGRNATLTYRTTLWSISFKWILERPWFGYGYLDDDSFNFMVKERTTTGLFNTGNPHNTYLTLLLAGGIVLLAFFIFILIRTSRMSRECPILITNVLSGFLTTLMLHAQVEGRDQAFILLICCVIYYVSKIKDELPIINKKRLKLFE